MPGRVKRRNCLTPTTAQADTAAFVCITASLHRGLQVLRANRDALLTVVGVVIHDPLYRWALTPIDVQRRQHQQANDATAPLAGACVAYGYEVVPPGCLSR